MGPRGIELAVYSGRPLGSKGTSAKTRVDRSKVHAPGHFSGPPNGNPSPPGWGAALAVFKGSKGSIQS